MRILIATPVAPPRIGGVETHVARMAAALKARGHEVEVLAASDADTRDPSPWRRILQRLGLAGDVPPTGWSARVLKRARVADHVILHSYHQPHAALAALHLRTEGIPYLVTPHYHGTGHSPLRRLLHRLWLPMGRGLLRGARRVIAVSPAEGRLLRRDFGLTAEVIPNGTDPVEHQERKEESDSPESERLILQVGRLEPYKGVERLIRASAQLLHRQDAPSFRVIVCGEGSERERLELLAQELSAPVEFLGLVDDERLIRLRQEAYLHITFSQEESFGLALAEALVAGGNVVCSDIPAHRDVVELARAEVVWANPNDGRDDVELLHRALTAPPQTPSILPSWQQAAERLSELLAAMPSASHIQSSKSVVRQRPAPIRRLVRSLGMLFAALLLAALLLVLAFHFHAQDQRGLGFGLFWLSLIPSFGLVAALSFTRYALLPGFRLWAIALLALFGALPKLLRSWGEITYSDEFAHYRLVQVIAEQGNSDGHRSLIRLAGEFPGLHAATAALDALLPLSVFWAGVAVVILAHTIAPLGVYYLARTLGGSERAAAIATFVYLANPSWLLFQAQFAYESLAIGFVIWGVALGIAATKTRLPWQFVGAAILLGALALTHHLTAIETSLILIAYAAIVTLRVRAGHSGARESAPLAWALAAVAVLTTIFWQLSRWGPIKDYYAPSATGPVNTIYEFFSGEGSVSARPPFGGSTLPLFEQLNGLALPFVLFALYLLALLVFLPLRRRVPSLVIWAALIGGGYFASLVYLLSNSGSEGARRSWAISYLGLALLFGLALDRGWPALVRRYRASHGLKIDRRLYPLAVALTTMVIVVGGIAVGQNEAYRFPGPQIVGSDTRSLSPETASVARWFASNAEGRVIFADRFVRGPIGIEADVEIITASTTYPLWDLTLGDAPLQPLSLWRVADADLDYLVIDRRMASERPQIGYWYASTEPGARETGLISEATLTQLACMPWLEAVFATENYTVYRVDLTKLDGRNSADISRRIWAGGACS